MVPFLAGSTLALWLYPRLAASGVPFPVFVMFLGIAMSVTAFPVLARILTDRNLHHTPLGMTALSCAAVNDVIAWCLLAAAVGMAQARGSSVVRMLVLSVSFVVVVLALVRPALGRLVRRQEQVEKLAQRTLSLVMMCLLASALAAEAIGIHALFGAFLLGAVPFDMRTMIKWFGSSGYAADIPSLESRWGIRPITLKQWVRTQR